MHWSFKNSTLLPQVRFWLCSGGIQKGSLSLWIVENSTGPEEQRRLWHSAREPKSERGWKLVILPLYGLADWYDEHWPVTSPHNSLFDYIDLYVWTVWRHQTGTLTCLRADKLSSRHTHTNTKVFSQERRSFRKRTKLFFYFFSALVNLDFQHLHSIFWETLPLNSTKLMNPIGTLVSCHGPSMCRVVENIPLSFYSTCLWWRE